MKTYLNRNSYYLAFENIKNEVLKLKVNTQFRDTLKSRVKTDVSHSDVGASLEELIGSDGKLLTFASVFLNTQEAKNSSNHFYFLGMLWAVDSNKN